MEEDSPRLNERNRSCRNFVGSVFGLFGPCGARFFSVLQSPDDNHTCVKVKTTKSSKVTV